VYEVTVRDPVRSRLGARSPAARQVALLVPVVPVVPSRADPALFGSHAGALRDARPGAR
jgi:hypothetical protein